MPNHFLDFAAYLADALICCDLFDRALKYRFKPPFIRYFFVILYALMMTANCIVIETLALDSVQSNYEIHLMTLCLGISICFCQYKGKLSEIIIYFGIIYICHMLSNAFFIFLYAVVKWGHGIPLMDNFAMSFGYRVVVFIICRFYQKHFFKTKHRIEGKTYYAILLLPFFTVIFGIYLVRMDFQNASDRLFITFSVPILMFLNVIVFLVVDKFSRLQYENYELAVLKQKVEIEKNYYDRLDEIEQKQVIVRHDIKHYISVMKMLCTEKKYDELENLLCTFESGMNKITPKTYIQNRIVNALFCEKESCSTKNGIKLSIDVEPNVSFSYLSDIDSISLFGNLIDNAVRAETESSGDERKVELKLFEGEGNFNVLSVTNHYSEIKKEKGVFLTTKKVQEGHGIGLKSVSNIVEKYKGIMNIDTSDGLFEVTVCLPK